MRTPLTNFSKGELGPQLYGRIDTQQYSAGLKVARNFLVQRYGGVTFRPGTRVVGEIDNSQGAFRLLPFQFSLDQSYILLMEEGQMRPIANGGFVIEEELQVTGVVRGDTTILTIPFHGYSVGDRLFLNNIHGVNEINGRFVRVLSVPDADRIVVDVDSNGFGEFTGSNGVLRDEEPAPRPADPVVEPPATPIADPDVGGGGGFDYKYDHGGRAEQQLEQQ